MRGAYALSVCLPRWAPPRARPAAYKVSEWGTLGPRALSARADYRPDEWRGRERQTERETPTPPAQKWLFVLSAKGGTATSAAGRQRNSCRFLGHDSVTAFSSSVFKGGGNWESKAE